MPNKALSDWMPYVLPDCPGCPEIAAEGAVSSALIDFCERTLLYQRDHDPVGTIAGIADYDLEAPETGYLVCKVMKAWYQLRPLYPTTPDQMDDPTHYNPLVGSNVGRPTHFTQKDERSITLWRAPQEAVQNALTIRVALKPKRSTTSVDEMFFEDWVEVIAAGAKASLQIIPGKSFTNPLFAAANQGAFTAGINRAMVKANKGHTRANLSVRMIKI